MVQYYFLGYMKGALLYICRRCCRFLSF